MRTRLSNQLKALLKGYFPQALELCGDDLTTLLACAFLQKWSSLQQLKKARPETIRRFYYAQNARRGDVIEKRLTLIAQAIALTNDPALIESSIVTLQALTLGLRAVHTAIARFDREIARTFTQHPDASLFAALPGSGTVYSARLRPPSVLVANALKAQKRCSTSAALLPFLNAVDRPPLFIAATPGRSSFTRVLSNTPTNRSATAFGPAPFTKCTRPPNKATGSSSALWLTNGSASSFAAGSNAPLTTNFATSNHFKKAAPPYSNTLPNPTPKLFE